MKKLLILGGLLFIGAAGWSVGASLSSDALSMAVGILLGVLAGLPTALLVLTSSRRHDEDRREQRSSARGQSQPYGQLPPGYPPQGYAQPQPPMIVFAGQQQPQLPPASGYPAPGFRTQEEAWAGERESRRFRVVGEEDGFVQ